MKNHDSLQHWAQELAHWVRRVLGLRVLRFSSPEVLSQPVYTAECALWRLRDPSITGCVEYWKFIRRDTTGDFVILLINTGQFRADLGQRRRTAGVQPWQRDLATDLERQLESQARIAASHLWVTCWIESEQRTDRKGRRYRTPVAVRPQVLALDLQGVTGEINGDRYARHILKVVAERLLRLEGSRLNTWQELVEVVPWLQWLEFYARYFIHREHILQPLRKRANSRLR